MIFFWCVVHCTNSTPSWTKIDRNTSISFRQNNINLIVKIDNVLLLVCCLEKCKTLQPIKDTHFDFIPLFYFSMSIYKFNNIANTFVTMTLLMIGGSTFPWFNIFKWFLKSW
jgi:hypothetical protein